MSVRSRFWRIYILPAAVFQAVMIGGGYGTGREIVEYFTRFGIAGGLAGLALAGACFAVLLAVSFEFARVCKAYDYQRFIRTLLGRGWVAFELLYLAMFAVVLAVIAAAAGTLFEAQLHLNRLIGVLTLLALVTVVAFYGRQWVVRILAFKSALLTIVFLSYFAIILARYLPNIVAEVQRGEVVSGWIAAALRYVLYSSVVVPAMLFAVTEFRTRRESMAAGAIAAVGGLIPGVLLHLSFSVAYPAVLGQAIPAYWVIVGLGLPALTVAYLVVLFGCLMDTGLCFIQSVNERLDAWRQENDRSPLSPALRAAVAVACVSVSAALSFAGVVPLVAQGYGTLAWGFLALYVGPLLSVGLYRLALAPGNAGGEVALEHRN